ncbi:MAG: PQQ-binding-like beta-propeller repeat protein [Clostridia bacterium]|nr:PQQ-binding-like beta-propeller repeat protein [Clostridia bacterium]
MSTGRTPGSDRQSSARRRSHGHDRSVGSRPIRLPRLLLRFAPAALLAAWALWTVLAMPDLSRPAPAEDPGITGRLSPSPGPIAIVDTQARASDAAPDTGSVGTPDLRTQNAHPEGPALPQSERWRYHFDVHVDGAAVDHLADWPGMRFDADDYTDLPGVVTFRGGNLRQNAAYGSAALRKRGFRIQWQKRIGGIDSGYTRWTGVGWTGQPVLVRWPDRLRGAMNLAPAYRQRSDLVEVICGTLDGNIYFLDASTGKSTRPPIKLGFPIKGSVSIDPRGYPLLYVGQGISRADGRTGRIGWRIYSLLDQRELFFLDGHDPLCRRDHGAFDGACLINGDADAALLGGENGLFYVVRLNTVFDAETPSIEVHPEVIAYRYRSAASPELGIENSVTACGHYAWFADNSGLVTCLDLDTLRPAWLFDAGDDTDATIALEPEDDGRLALYTVNQIDKRGRAGRCTVRRLDALTGVTDWSYAIECTSDVTNGGGGFASPAIGRNAYARYVYFNVCRTEGGGTLICFDKQTGEVRWQRSTGSASWSSPVLVYRPDGTGALVLCTNRKLRMYDPADGKPLGSVDIDGKIEASPAVFDDIMVIGTRNYRICGVRLT